MLLGLIIWASIRAPYVQSWLVKQVTNYAATELKTSIQIGAIDADLFNHLILRNIVVIDQKKDTLLNAGILKVYLSDVLFMNKSATFSAIRLEKVQINCSRKLSDSTFNYQFILDALKSTDTTPSKNSWKLAFKKIYLSDVALDYNDAYNNHINSSINQLVVDFKSTDLLKKEIRINDLHINGASVCITPYAAKADKLTQQEQVTPAIKSFNPEHWLIGMRNFEISSSRLFYNRLTIDSNQTVNYEPLDVSQIGIQLTDLKLEKDTLDGQLNTIQLKEAKGFELKEMSTHFSMNTEQLSLADFIVQTPNTSINSQLTFTYSELADLNNFIEMVQFKALFKESKIGVEDVRYFTQLPTAFKDALVIDGAFTGSVANLRGSNLTLSMGANLFKVQTSQSGQQ